MIADSIAIDELLLVLKIAFLALLYLFIWQIVRTASRDIRVPQESFVLRPGQVEGLPAAPAPGRLVVVRSPTLAPGEQRPLDSRPLTIGRSPENDVELAGDEYASASHARVAAGAQGAWVEDLGSTNGTFVNGVRLDGRRRLAPGDVVRIGETQLRYES